MTGSGSESEGDDEIYVVEAIVGSRFDKHKGTWRYRIKWKGYGDDEMTWEPASNLNCPDLLAAFEASNQSSKPTSRSRKQDAEPSKRKTKSAAASSRSKSRARHSLPAASGRAGKGKGKERAQSADMEEKGEDTSEEESELTDLEDIPAEAQVEAAKSMPRKSPRRAQTVVTDRQERQNSSKVVLANGSDNTVFVTNKTSSSRGSEKHYGRSSRKRLSTGGDSLWKAKTPRKSPGSDQDSGASNTKGVASRVRSDSDSDAEPPHKRSNVSQLRDSSSKVPNSISGNRAPISPRSSIEKAKDVGQLARKATTSTHKTISTSNPIRSMRFKRVSSSMPDLTSQAETAEANGTSTPAIPGTTKHAPAATDPSNTNRGPASTDCLDVTETNQPAPKSASLSAKSSVHFAEDVDTSSRTHSSSRAQSPVGDLAERAAAVVVSKEMEEHRRSLASLESRLTSSEYYRRTKVFQRLSIAAACAEAVRFSRATVLRMKGLSVAIISGNRDQMVSGESIALGLLLLMTGAKMPKQLSEVAIVCIHRRETLAPVEKMYTELVNVKGHHVEFLHFGDEQSVQPILVSALQQGMAVESFCMNTRDGDIENFTIVAHPASIILARLRLPQWQRVAGTLDDNNIPVAEKRELSLSSTFVSIDKNKCLASSTDISTLPTVNAQSELAEITDFLCWKREQDPARWRRFIIVVGLVDPVASQVAKDRGIELCTWVGLTELSRECVF